MKFLENYTFKFYEFSIGHLLWPATGLYQFSDESEAKKFFFGNYGSNNGGYMFNPKIITFKRPARFQKVFVTIMFIFIPINPQNLESKSLKPKNL